MELQLFISARHFMLTIFLLIFASSCQHKEDVIPYVERDFLVEVIIPKYDPTNPEHFLITETNNGWDQINNPAYQYFFVDPGEYDRVWIEQSGSESKPKFICLNNTTELHPAQLSDGEQANVRLTFEGVQHWVIDRLSCLDDDVWTSMIHIKPVSKHILLNRMHFRNFQSAIDISGGTSNENYTSNITIQNCRIEGMTQAGMSADRCAILLTGMDTYKYRRIEDVHIVNNEIVNCNDGIMPLRISGSKKHDANYAGLVISDNHIYVDNRVYTDGNGNLDPNGEWSMTENAIDLKAGSDYPLKPIVVRNNYMWGYRRTDKEIGGSGDMGYAMVVHYHVKNLIINDNVIFDCSRGMGLSGADGLPYSCENVHIYHNIIANISEKNNNDIGYAINFEESKNVLFEKNIIAGVGRKARWLSTDGNETDLTLTNNVFISLEAKRGVNSKSTNIIDNFFYNTPLQNGSEGKYFENASDAKMTSLTFTTDRFTNNPHEITVYNVVSTSYSPHGLLK